MKFHFFLIFTTLTISLSSFSSQRQETIFRFIDAPNSLLDQAFEADVRLVNHYLSWQNKKGYSFFLNTEFIVEYFNFYNEKYDQSQCPNHEALLKSSGLDINEYVPKNFINKLDSMIKSMETSRVETAHPKVRLSVDSVIFRLCQFSRQALIHLPFHPPGFEKPLENFDLSPLTVDQICYGITQEITTQVLARNSTYNNKTIQNQCKR